MNATKINVGTTPTKLADGEAGTASYPQSVAIKPSGGTVYVGGADVDSTNGFPVASGEVLLVDFVTSDLYAVVSTGTVDVNVLTRI